MKKSMKEESIKIRDCIQCAEKTYRYFLLQKISRMTGCFNDTISMFESALAHEELQEVLAPVVDNLAPTLEAFEGKDYVLFGDYLQKLIIEPLYVIQEEFVAGFEDEYGCPEGYGIENTSSAYPTLWKQKQGKKHYLHSNINPCVEPFSLVNKWRTPGVQNYVVLGLGLGYHVWELLDQVAGNICVYEEDLNIIELARKYSPVAGLFDNSRVTIIYDPGYLKFAQFAEKIEQKECNLWTGLKDEKICIFYPEITVILDEKLREDMIRIYSHIDNMEQQGDEMLLNFCNNVEKYTKVGDELRKKFEGRRVFLVAGGPSLDKNGKTLKKKRPEDIVITVGTSLKKCLRDELPVDYVFTIDSKKDGIYQFDGVYQCGIPMIFLATAYRNIVDTYEADKYIIFQDGYEPSEKISREKGYKLYATGGSVTTTAVDFCIQMGVSEVIFVGVDLANTGGKSHHSGTAEAHATRQEGAIMVEDVYGNQVGTTYAFNEYRGWIERRIQRAMKEKSGVCFLDATEGGAKIAGTEIVKLEEVI